MNISRPKTARKIGIIGANGQLGSELLSLLPQEHSVGWTRKDFDVSDFTAVRQHIASSGIQHLINTASYHRTDECEDHPEQAFRINSLAVAHLASLCKQFGIALVHISTDYIFDGNQEKPYSEEDPAHPINVYGMSKLLGEESICLLCPEHFIIRTSAMFGRKGSVEKGGSFLDRMFALAQQGKTLRVVNDQRFSPTYATHLARQILKLIQTENFGIYHITNSGDTTWYELAKTAFEIRRWQVDVQPVTSEQFAARARRPRYSVLDNSKILKLGFPPLPHWKEALKEYILLLDR